MDSCQFISYEFSAEVIHTASSCQLEASGIALWVSSGYGALLTSEDAAAFVNAKERIFDLKR